MIDVIDPEERSPHPLKVAVSGKGGVGKTWLLVRLARWAAQRGLMTLLVDSDAQGSATRRLIGQPTSTAYETVDSIHQQLRQGELIPRLEYDRRLREQLRTAAPNLDLLPMGQPTGQGCFCPAKAAVVSFVREVEGYYDLILLDVEAGQESGNRGLMAGYDLVLIVAADEPDEVENESVRVGEQIEAAIWRELPEVPTLRVLNKATDATIAPQGWVGATQIQVRAPQEEVAIGLIASLLTENSLTAPFTPSLFDDGEEPTNDADRLYRLTDNYGVGSGTTGIEAWTEMSESVYYYAASALLSMINRPGYPPLQGWGEWPPPSPDKGRSHLRTPVIACK